MIKTNLPKRYATGDGEEEGSWERDRRSPVAEHKKAAEDWTKALAQQGWVAPHWPKEYGGAGLSPMEQFIFKQEMAASGAPAVGGQCVSQLGPTIQSRRRSARACAT